MENINGKTFDHYKNHLISEGTRVNPDGIRFNAMSLDKFMEEVPA